MKKTIILTFSLTAYLVIASNAKAATTTVSSCDGKCTVYIDTVTHDVLIEKNPEVPENEEVIIPHGLFDINWSRFGGYARNVVIGEGITGSDSWGLSTYANMQTGTADGTLTLPSTFKSSTNDTPFWNISFGTIDASALKDTELNLPQHALQNLIIDENSNLKINLNGSYGAYASNVKIQCKGTDLKACTDQISYPANKTTITTEYYSETDSKGRIHQWSKDGLFIYQYSPNGDYALYDENENLLGHFMSNGSKRRIYSVDEATAVVQTGAKNTFSIKYR